VLDTTFAGAGYWMHDNAAGWGGVSKNDGGRDILLDASGRIVVAGFSRGTPHNTDDMVIWRYNPDGTLDTSFDDPADGRGPGWVVHHNAAGAGGEDYGNAIALDASGRILVAGESQGTGYDMVIWRYNADGTPDTTFDDPLDGRGPGWVIHDGAAGGGSFDDHGYAITTDASGRILVAGDSHNNGTDTVVWRYNPDGTPDITFDGDGWLVYPAPDDDSGRGITTDASGRILVTGYQTGTLSTLDMMLWRYNPDGSSDITFGGGGVRAHHDAAGGGGDDMGYAITLDGSGRILVAGESWSGVNLADMVIWRINPDGNLDPLFMFSGWATHNVEDNDHAYDIATDSTGRIFVAGECTSGAGTNMVLWCFR
jgi:uncharacterized delta-60 repeat protein